MIWLAQRDGVEIVTDQAATDAIVLEELPGKVGRTRISSQQTDRQLQVIPLHGRVPAPVFRESSCPLIQ
jgi:hypothetical protein